MVEVTVIFLSRLLTPRAALYAEMQEGLLSKQAEYASRPLRDEVKSEFPSISPTIADC